MLLCTTTNRLWLCRKKYVSFDSEEAEIQVSKLSSLDLKLEAQQLKKMLVMYQRMVLFWAFIYYQVYLKIPCSKKYPVLVLKWKEKEKQPNCSKHGERSQLWWDKKAKPEMPWKVLVLGWKGRRHLVKFWLGFMICLLKAKFFILRGLSAWNANPLNRQGTDKQ